MKYLMSCRKFTFNVKFSLIQCVVLDGVAGPVSRRVPKTVRKRDKDIVSRQNLKIVLAFHRMEWKHSIHHVPRKNVMVCLLC